MFGRIYKTRYFYACLILIALTCLIRNSFFNSDRILIDEAVAAEYTMFAKTEFARLAQVDSCPVCFGQDMCKDLAKKDLEISRYLMFIGPNLYYYVYMYM